LRAADPDIPRHYADGATKLEIEGNLEEYDPKGVAGFHASMSGPNWLPNYGAWLIFSKED
jgi:hypothetical protein